ncbi:death-inducer obliterator 1-like [Sabethes cyaneus]|uniref:death-inducer obliterator 1-like n=1 Tax=Sabethes cyaneus TaxID=53552 RepID=UPI00237D4E5D|nr:death-inducer obliterator 1-like [Sabethes cyaneus]
MSRVSDGFDCGACERPNSVYDMVQCDACSIWYHMDCAEVTPGVSNREWFCETCTLSGTSSLQAVDATKKSSKQVTAKSKKGKAVTSSQGLEKSNEISGVSSSRNGRMTSDGKSKSKPLTSSCFAGGLPPGGEVSGDCGTSRATALASDNVARNLPLGGATLAGCGTSREKVPRTGDIAKRLPLGGASSADLGTPKKHPAHQKRANTLGGSAKSSTSSSRALAQLALQRLEEKRKIEEQKLELQQRGLEKEKERLQKEKEIESKRNFGANYGSR